MGCNIARTGGCNISPGHRGDEAWFIGLLLVFFLIHPLPKLSTFYMIIYLFFFPIIIKLPSHSILEFDMHTGVKVYGAETTNNFMFGFQALHCPSLKFHCPP